MGMLAWDVLFLVLIVGVYSWAVYRFVVQSKMRVEQHVRVGPGSITVCESGYIVEVPLEIPQGSIFQDGIYEMNFMPSRFGVRVACDKSSATVGQNAIVATFRRKIDAEEAHAILHRKYFWAHLIEQKRGEMQQTG